MSKRPGFNAIENAILNAADAGTKVTKPAILNEQEERFWATVLEIAQEDPFYDYDAQRGGESDAEA